MAQDDERLQQPQEMSIVNEFLGMLLEGEDESQAVHIAKMQADGTLRTWSLQVGRDEDGVERVLRVDDAGRQENVLIVTDGDGNKLPISGTESGVLRVDIAGAAKSQEVAILNLILAELRLHSMQWQEMTESGIRLEDLGEMEPKESL